MGQAVLAFLEKTSPPCRQIWSQAVRGSGCCRAQAQGGVDSHGVLLLAPKHLGIALPPGVEIALPSAGHEPPRILSIRQLAWPAAGQTLTRQLAPPSLPWTDRPERKRISKMYPGILPHTGVLGFSHRGQGRGLDPRSQPVQVPCTFTLANPGTRL